MEASESRLAAEVCCLTLTVLHKFEPALKMWEISHTHLNF